MFVDGNLSVSPGGQEIFTQRVQAVLIIETGGFAGKFKLGAGIDLPGISLSGQWEAFINTFGSDVTFNVPVFLQSVVGFNSVTVYGGPPKINPDFDINNLTGAVLVEDTQATAGAYLVIAGAAHLTLLDTITLQGAFRVAISTSGLEVQAAVGTSITIPGASSSLFDLTGTMAFAIDAEGIYGRADLALAVSTTTILSGFDLTASFILEFNTAGSSKAIDTFTFDTSTGAQSLTVVEVVLPAQTLRLVAGGELVFSPGSSGGDAFTMKGRFEFVLSPTLVEIQASVAITVSSLVDVSASAAMRLAYDNGVYFAGFVIIGASAGADAPGAGTPISGTGFQLEFNLALFINTHTSNVTIAGVELAAESVTLEASGYLEITLGINGSQVAGFRIEGELLVTDDNDGFSVSVNGTMTLQLAEVTILSLGASGGLLIENQGTDQDPLYAIAGILTLTQGQGSVVNGNGFVFNASFTLELNTTDHAVDLGLGGDPDLVSGIYARVHADGTLGFLVANTGFVLDGVFDLEVDTNGLIITTEADFIARVAGTDILKLNAVGFLLINASGIAAKIDLTLGTGADTSGTGFSLGGTFTFELNTTNQFFGTINGVNVNLAAGPFVRLAIDGHIALSVGNANSFRLEGSLVIEASSSGLEVAADATLKAIVANTTILSLNAQGALLIGTDGIAAKINMGTSLGGTGFSFSGLIVFELNTSSQFISSIAGQTVNLQAGPYAQESRGLGDVYKRQPLCPDRHSWRP